MKTRFGAATVPRASAWVALFALSISTPLAHGQLVDASHGRPPDLVGSPAGRAPTSASLPLLFEQNAGQFDAGTLFAVRGSRITLATDGDGLALRLAATAAGTASSFSPLALRWVGTSQRPLLQGERPAQSGVSYLFGRDRTRWLTGIPAYHRVRWHDAYPGIDVVFYGADGQLEYDLELARGADPGQVRLRFEGANAMRPNATGDLEIDTAAGTVVQHLPRVYQVSADEPAGRAPVGARYSINSKGDVAIALDSYDRTRALIIDPVLTWATVLGGSQSDWVYDVATDSTGAAYLLVETYAPDFPVRAALGAITSPNSFTVVTKLSPGGEEIVYSTAIGGASGRALSVDAAGAVYVAGATWSDEFPVVNAYQGTCRSRDDGACSLESFLLKLDASGTMLVFATYLGGSGWDEARGLVVDSEGRAIIAGNTESPDFPTFAAIKPSCPTCDWEHSDLFVTKFSADGTTLVFSTYLGGGGSEWLRDLDVDDSDALYVSGDTWSADYPATTTFSVATPLPFARAFATKVTANGSGIAYSDLFDGLQYLQLAVDTTGALHLGGGVWNDASSTVHSDLYIARLDATGAAMTWSQRLGGSGAESLDDLALGPGGADVVVGQTCSNDFPTRGALQERRFVPVWRSTDLGERFVPASQGLPSGMASIAFDPINPDVCYLGTSQSGIFRSTDGGATWTARWSDGLQYVRSLVAAPRAPGMLFAVVGTYLYRSLDAGATWFRIGLPGSGLTGTPFTVAADPFWGTYVYVGSSDGVFVSADSGITWSRSPMTFPRDVTAVVTNPTRAGTVYAVSRGVWKSTDRGATWTRIAEVSYYTGITALVVDPARGERLYLATDRGALLRSDNGGATWEALQPPGVPTNAMDVAPNGTVYLAGGGGLFVSVDAGITWAPIGPGLLSPSKVAVNPLKPALVLASASGGCDGFVALVDPALPAPPADAYLAFSSYLGGTGDEAALSVDVGLDGSVLVSGVTSSRDFPATTWLTSPAASVAGSKAFLARIDRLDDPDGDGMPTAWELAVGLDPNVAEGDADADGDGVSNFLECEAETHPRGMHTLYFAEGVTSTFFDTILALVNPSATNSAHVWLRFLSAEGLEGHRGLVIPPLTRRTLDVKAVAGLEQAEASTIIESDVPVAVDRVVSWNARAYGSHGQSALPAPAASWYFAEGATHFGFQLFYLLENPNAVTALVRATFLPGDGRPAVARDYTLPPLSRTTVWVNYIPGLEAVDLGATFETDTATPILVERAMYLDAAGQTFGAGHASAGTSVPSTTWYFAEGATGAFFDLFLLLANPTVTDATVEVDYLKPDGSVVTRQYQVPAEQRRTIWVDQEDPALADTAVAMTLTAINGIPFVAERAMWWPGPTAATWHEGHCAAGVATPATRWVVADGIVNGPSGAETYVLVSNPTGIVADVQATLLFEDGGRATRTFSVLPHSRTNVAVKDDAWAFATLSGSAMLATGARVGVVIESLGASPVPLVVESAIYWNATGADGRTKKWAAGHATPATPLPD